MIYVRVIDLATMSMVGGSGIVESKIPLWGSDGTSVSQGNTIGYYLKDGSSSSTNTASVIFTLSSNWPSSLKYAFEATIWTSNSSYIAEVSLYDVTLGQSVSSLVTSTSTTSTVVRSGQFILTPGHGYAISVVCGGSATMYICDASLIVFPQ
jgi:hypothetical protein